MGALVRYEKPDEEALSSMTAQEKKQVNIRSLGMSRSTQSTLWNILHHIKVLSLTCDEVRSFQSLHCL